MFEWNLETDTEVDPESRIEASQVLRFSLTLNCFFIASFILTYGYRIIPFTNAKYESVAPIRTLESKGLQGHSILIEGVKSGSAFVSARLKDTPYEVSSFEQTDVSVFMR